MIRAAIVGLGWWGQNLVNGVRGSDSIRFMTAHTRTRATAAGFCADTGLHWVDSLDAVLDDTDIDAVVFATPHTLHSEQVIRAAGAGRCDDGDRRASGRRHDRPVRVDPSGLCRGGPPGCASRGRYH